MSRWLPFGVLLLCGASWGATQPLTKIAVSEGYRHVGILFWSNVLVALLLGILCIARGRSIPVTRPVLVLYAVVAAIGTVLPGIASYSAAVHLPSGVLSMLLSLVPMLAFPVALLMRTDRFHWLRLAGLALGLAGVALLILPEDGLPTGIDPVWIGIAMIASACYALEGNYVAKYGTQGLDALQVLTGASVVGAIMTLPMAVLGGQWIDPRLPWGGPDLAVIASSVLHGVAYTGYVWMVGAAGAVFAVQVSYFVTLFGVCWAMLFLNEAYSTWFWAALVLLLGGLALVQPRAVVPAGRTDVDGRARS